MTYTPEQIAEWKANRKKWVEALRSGEYVQGTGVLHCGDYFCCLGVLCEVAGIEYIDDEIYAPQVAKRFVGLSTGAGRYGGDSLVNANDSGTPFSEIADIIESEPKGLFLESGE